MWRFRRKHSDGSVESNESEPFCEVSEIPELHPPRKSWRQMINALGWRFTIINGAVLSLIVFALNLTGTILARKRGDSNDDSVSRETLFHGDCDKVKHLSFAAHLFINLFSTILLSASNFAMQCLSSPTRQEVDRAHSQSKWLDIGVLSPRNLSKISRKRALLWFVLTTTSLPLHLLYNSAVYSTIYAFDYTVFSANNDIIQSNSTKEYFNLYPEFHAVLGVAPQLRSKAQAGQLIQLNPSDCISSYATVFQTRFRHLILVTDGDVSNNTYEYSNIDGSKTNFRNASDFIIKTESVPFGWICGLDQLDSQPDCGQRWKSVQGSNWSPLGNNVDHCLAEKFEQKCELRFSFPLILTVLLFNLTKTLVLFYIFFFMKDNPLLTLGDALASFLKSPDSTTEGHCLLSMDRITAWEYQSQMEKPEPQRFEKISRIWGMGATGTRWYLCVMLYLAAIIACIAFLATAVKNTNTSFRKLLSFGFGAIDPRTLVNWKYSNRESGGLLVNTIVANLPQLVLSVIYYTYNSLCTSFMLGYEWDSIAILRKGLRVSHDPQGMQRSTHFLELPYKVAFPLMAMSGLLHWFCSSSLFLVMIQVDEADELATCGYSVAGMFGLVILGGVMLMGSFYIGNIQFKSSAPSLGSCSAAISAMVHPPEVELARDPARLPVKWGVVPGSNFTACHEEYGHCSVSTLEVSEPQDGHLYAG